MDIHNLKQGARDALTNTSSDPKKLVLTHSAISLGALLAATVLSTLLNQQIANTSGLGSLGTRSVLSTAVSVLQLAVNILLPIWSVGFVAVSLRISRGEQATAANLTESLRRAGPVLRLVICKELVILLLAFLCAYPSAIIFMLTPLAEPLTDLLMPLLADPNLDPNVLLAQEEALLQAILPVFFIYIPLLLAVATPIFYYFRMADFLIMDTPGCGAIAALVGSVKLMRRNGWKLFKLDLSYWWYYAALGAVACVSYADALLALLGIASPLNPEMTLLVTYSIYCLLQLGLDYVAKPQVEVTYALVYNALKSPAEYPGTEIM